MIKLFIFLKRAPMLTDEALWTHWLDVRAPLVARVPACRERAHRYVVNRALHEVAILELTLSDLDGADELWFDNLDDLRAVIGDPAFSAAVQADVAFLDPTRTIVLPCQESVQFERGFGSVKFMGLSRRHPSLGHDEWCRYWIDVHGPLAHGIPEFTRYYGRYVHNYVIPDDPAEADSLEFDGIVEEWLENADAMAQCLAEPKYLEHVRPDELAFVDFSRSHMLLAEEHVIFDRNTGAALKAARPSATKGGRAD